jgi:uncharacterized protein (TIGR02118 family)
MEKTVGLISRRSDLTRAQFRDYYETRHAPLGTQHFAFRKYLRNHVVGPASDAFDVFSEFWHDSIAKAYEVNTGPIGAIFREDEQRFMGKQRAAKSEERLVAGPARIVDPTPTRKQILLLVRREGTDRAGFLDAAARWGGDLAASSKGGITRVVLDAITPFENTPFPCDAILSLWLANGAEETKLGAPPTGITLGAVATVESCETPPEVLAANYKGE